MERRPQIDCHVDRIVLKRLGQVNVMQLATVDRDGAPWNCSVWFVAANDGDLYWLSYPERRHSRNVLVNNKAAIAIAVKADAPVIGIQAQGKVEIVNDETIVQEIMESYVQKYQKGEHFYERFRAGTNRHQLYRFRPDGDYTLFDETPTSE